MTTEPIEKAKWIEDEQLPRTNKNFELTGCTIGQCIPPIFECYCKIFHPFEVTPDEPDILEPKKQLGQMGNLTIKTHPDSGLQVTITFEDGNVIDIPKQHEERQREYKSKTWHFATWRSIAEKYDLVFHNEVNGKTFADKFQTIGWPRNLKFPSEGYLPRELLVNLLKKLENISNSDQVYIYQMLPNSIFKDNKDCDLVKCTFNEVLEYFDTNFIGYLYPEDKSWVVFTDTDLCFSIVGGPKRLVDLLLSSDLEILECNATTRVDNFSDKMNPRRSAPNSTSPNT